MWRDGEWTRDGRILQCFHDHANLDLAAALATSCNAYLYEVVHRLGTDQVAATFETFGLHGLSTALREAPEAERMAIAVGHGTGTVTPPGHARPEMTPGQRVRTTTRSRGPSTSDASGTSTLCAACRRPRRRRGRQRPRILRRDALSRHAPQRQPAVGTRFRSVAGGGGTVRGGTVPPFLLVE